MKNQKHESLAQHDRLKKIEKQTESFRQTKGKEQNEPNKFYVLNVVQFQRILKKTRISTPEPIQFSDKVFDISNKDFPRCLKAYICVPITSPLNSSYVLITSKESQDKVLSDWNKNIKEPEKPNQSASLIVVQKHLKLQ